MALIILNHLYLNITSKLLTDVVQFDKFKKKLIHTKAFGNIAR